MYENVRESLIRAANVKAADEFKALIPPPEEASEEK